MKFQGGSVNFSKASFGRGDIQFSRTDFGGAEVKFNGAQFEEGNVNFFDIICREKNFIFDQVNFKNGTIDFSCSKYLVKNASFRNVNFGEGVVLFTSAIFERGADFSETDFGTGFFLDFDSAKFIGNTSFKDALFRKNNITFKFAAFEGEKVTFENAYFDEGKFDFSNTSLKCEHINFNFCNFNSPALFENLNAETVLKSFSFKYASINAISISCLKEKKFPCIPDLIGTKTNHHVSLEGLKLDEEKLLESNCTEASQKLCRLKEIAENNKDHQKALDFHILEMKAKRNFQWEKYSCLKNTEFWFEKLGDYGRSIELPLSWLGLTFIVFSWGYLFLSYIHTGMLKLFTALEFSAAQLLVFLPSTKFAREETIKSLFPDGNLPHLFFLLTSTQSLISFILLFLLGLALKHKFKL
jgi:hypothetical protein